MLTVGLDFETYYDKEYSLSIMSPFAYTHHPKFDAYLLSAYNNTGIKFVGRPEDFNWESIRGMTPVAHNASFDLHVYLRLVELGKIPDVLCGYETPWLCTADMAAYLGCKRDLKSACKILLDRTISKATRASAKGISGDVLRKDQEMLEYGLGDAMDTFDLMYQCGDKWPEKERRIAHENRITHMRGIPLDIDKVLKDIAVIEPQCDEQLARIPWCWERDEYGNKIKGDNGEYIRTTGPSTGPLSAPALKEYGTKMGLDVPSSTAKDNPDFLDWLKNNAEKIPWIDAIGKFRSLNTLTQRLHALRDGYDRRTGRFIYEKKYYGAFTGRFSGGSNTGAGGKFNMENIPKDVMYGINFRDVFISAPGHTLLIADYDQIEARILLWRVGDTEALKPCFKGASVYQAYAERTGRCAPGIDLKKHDKALYAAMKVEVLGCGYQAGPTALQKYARTVFNIHLSDEASMKTVMDFRKNNPLVADKQNGYWAQHHAALQFSARRRDPTHKVELPSGRDLVYWNPQQTGREIMVEQFRCAGFRKMYGGKATENEMQALGRDVMCDGWLAVVDSKWDMPILLTVHDELVTMVPDDEVDDRAVELERLMTTASPWAEGLPLGAEVMKSKVYMK